ncbi:MAG: SusD/RagB family nutrient-binding outer membrane lipoprotein [Bacteroidia bacterium]
MKKIIITLSAIILISTGCNKFVEDYDISPNEPLEVTPALLLTNAEVATFIAHSGQLARTSGIIVQQLEGTQFQMLDVAQYRIREGDVVNEWEVLYTNAMQTAFTLIEDSRAGETGGGENAYYRGIAKVLMAMNLGLATSLWGDVPYDEAFGGLDGSENFNPAYQPQEVIYQRIQTLLDEAIADFNVPDPAAANLLFPGAEDFIHGGDINAWRTTAYMLKARYHNHLSEVDPNGSATSALTAIAQAGLTGNGDDAYAVFGTNGNELNQWYSFENERAGYIRASEMMVDMMDTLDPRIPFYFSEASGGGYRGAELGSEDISASYVGPYFASANSPAPLITYAEVKFIEAEANLRAGNSGPAADAYNEAVIAHVTKVSGAAPPTVFIDEYASETAGSINLEKIMTQKYIAMFTQAEVWTDWRRKGIPAISPHPQGTETQIPVRLPTSLDERLYNQNATVVTNILTPVWWDR